MAATMFSRTSFHIRRFMSQRLSRGPTDDDSYDFKDVGLVDEKALDTRLPTLPRESTWPASAKPIDVRLSRGSHRLSTPLPPMSDTPHSSTSSLCSCCDGDTTTRRPANGSPVLCLTSSKTTVEDRRPHSLGAETRGDRSSSVYSSTSRNEEMNQLPEGSASTFDLLEALTLPLKPDAVVRRAAPPPRDRQRGVERWSDNVQQLIRETDEAFEAVGTALHEARLASQDPRAGGGIDKRQPQGRNASPHLPIRAVLGKQAKITTTHLKPPSRTASISKSKRKKSQKGRRPEQLPRKAGPAAKRNLRWTLTENVAEFFNEHLSFNRIEADEVLPPSRLQEIRMSRAGHVQPQQSTETLQTVETDGSETPIEPFHLEDLPSRIGAAGVRLSVPSPIAEMPTPRSAIPDGGGAVRRDFSLAPQGRAREHPDPPISDSMTFGEVSFPAPPARNPARLLPRRPPSQMPTIPEGTVAALPSKRAVRPAHEGVTSDDYVYFRSTPYTLTMPAFRHGTIRFTKAELGLEPKLLPDETLDWTAYQMAILGGAGDFFSESTDFTRRTDADEMDELAAWFDGFGFEGGGTLVAQDDDSALPSPLTNGSGDSSPATERALDADVADLPIPVALEYPNGFWNEGRFDASRTSRFFQGGGCSIRRWTVEGHPKRYEGGAAAAARRGSVDSLPQSPMLELVVSRAVGGEEYLVPMGYNLGHDLGDYLAWESEQMYAAAIMGD